MVIVQCMFALKACLISTLAHLLSLLCCCIKDIIINTLTPELVVREKSETGNIHDSKI